MLRREPSGLRLRRLLRNDRDRLQGADGGEAHLCAGLSRPAGRDRDLREARRRGASSSRSNIMSIIGWAVTALIPGGGIIGAVLKFGARTVFGKIGGALKSAGKFVGTNWKPLLVIAAIGAAV